MEIFQKRLIKLRNDNHYSQRKVAAVLGITQPSYIRYEKGEAEPTLENLVKLADLYDETVDYLLGRTDY